MLKLRGHHLFCLLGYRGMGYSKEYIENMTFWHQQLRYNPETKIQIIKGPDQLCEKYPNSGNYHCKDPHIYNRDEAILKKMGLEIGEIITWNEIESTIRKKIVPEDIHLVCVSCSWRGYGVCEEGIQEIIDGKGLREVT
ncbi:DUF1284 domain-containing protein [Metabacillus malikii]|uniref:DUF1284 domain-containing protein n=1 Tax=Metabacillus malikii TaxID=1504265 RepID=A0ABT9ZGF4_9BACI|nr:DUF1284 domain-containing protein [Metabacillus malikii]MDQ0231346.1 hypothetical protein [Metabacillus malikii]